jgi:hypothetical protein
MADNNSSSVSVVAIVAILLMLAFGGFLAWRAGVFGGGHSGDHKSLDVNFNTH